MESPHSPAVIVLGKMFKTILAFIESVQRYAINIKKKPFWMRRKMSRQKNHRYTHESTDPRKMRFLKPGFWIGLWTLVALMGLMANPWFQGESLLYAAVPSLKLETSDGVFEIGKPGGKILVLFFSFPG